uniref:RING-type domain-containing protein n=1 Tax=Meloidogyne incognita TaxID=6306 RepID=A0A914LAW5_MELIC
MDSFVKWMVKKITDVSGIDEKKKKCAEIEDAQKIRIDSSPLHCPVCLSVFFKSPEILPCGHSFCFKCIDSVRKSCVHLNRQRQAPFKNTFECPLCRFNVPLNAKKTRNYALEAILDSLEVYDEGNCEMEVNDSIAALQYANKRLKAEKQEHQQTIGELNNQLEYARKTIIRMITLFSLIGITLVAGLLAKEVWKFF